MEISLTPDIYAPIVDDNGNYVDKIPFIKRGIYCLCGSRKDKIYENSSKFSTHIKTKCHQKWLDHLNQNKANYYVEVLKSKEIIENQQRIIQQLDNRLQDKDITINYLTKQLTKNINSKTPSIDLLDF